MGVIIRQSIQNTIIAYLGIALGAVSTLLLYPRFFEPEQYGLTRLLISLAGVFAQFAHLGIKNIIIRYFPYFRKSKHTGGELLALTILVPLAGFVLFVLLFVLFRDTLVRYYTDQSRLFSEYVLFLLPLVFFVLFFEVLNTYMRSLQDSVTGSFLREVVMRVIIILLLVLYYFEALNFTQFILFFVSAYSIPPLCLMYYLYRKKELSFAIPFRSVSRRFAKGMGLYGAFALLGGLSTLLVGNIDILMLGAMAGLADTAIYAIAFYAGSVIAVPQYSINKIAAPVLAEFMMKKRRPQIEALYQRTSLNQIIAGSLLLVGIWANLHNLMYLLPDEYRGTEGIIIIIGLAKLFDMATGINGGIIINSRHYRFNLYANILLVALTIVTNYLLIPPYGILGAAIATAFSIFLYNLVKFIFVWITFGMQPFQWNAPAVLIIAAGCLLLSFQIPYLFNFYVDVLVRSLIIAIVFLGCILVFGLSDDVKRLAKESRRRVVNLLSTRF